MLKRSNLNKFGSLAAACLLSLIAIHTEARAANERFKEVLSRGIVRVGVQQALRPWGFRDPSGQLVGLEVDLAKDVADTLGVKLELVPIEIIEPYAVSPAGQDRRHYWFNGRHARASQSCRDG